MLLKLFDVNELLNSIKIENMSSTKKVKSLELELSVAREQLNGTSTSKLDSMLNVQKSSHDKTRLGFVESISNSIVHSTKFVPSSFEPKLDVRMPKEVLATRKIMVDLSESKP